MEHHRGAGSGVAGPLVVGRPAGRDARPRILPRPLDAGQGAHRGRVVPAGAHRGVDREVVARRDPHPQREAHGVQEPGQRPGVRPLSDQVGGRAVVARARPVLDAALGRQDQQFARVPRAHACDDLRAQRGEPRLAVLPGDVHDHQVRAGHEGAPALQRPLLARRIPVVLGRSGGSAVHLVLCAPARVRGRQRGGARVSRRGHRSPPPRARRRPPPSRAAPGSPPPPQSQPPARRASSGPRTRPPPRRRPRGSAPGSI